MCMACVPHIYLAAAAGILVFFSKTGLSLNCTLVDHLSFVSQRSSGNTYDTLSGFIPHELRTQYMSSILTKRAKSRIKCFSWFCIRLLILLSPRWRQWQNIFVVVLTPRYYAYSQSCCVATCVEIFVGMCKNSPRLHWVFPQECAPCNAWNACRDQQPKHT